MPRWYYSKKELKENPSVMNGVDAVTETRYRREGARFIMELGTTMNLSLQTTMATAVVFYHRFYMKHTFQDFPRYPTACACLFLAGKVEETPKKCRDMIENAKKLLPESKFTQQFGTDVRNQLEEVMTLERILLQTIKFDLQLEHPYKYLLKYAQSLKGDKARLERMVQMAWNFVNDSLCTCLCLQWEPEIIAIALMYLACKLSKFEVVDWNGRLKEHFRWWDMYVEDMSIDVLEDICHQVLDFYSQVKSPGNNSGSGTPTGSTNSGPPRKLESGNYPLAAANPGTPKTPSPSANSPNKPGQPAVSGVRSYHSSSSASPGMPTPTPQLQTQPGYHHRNMTGVPPPIPVPHPYSGYPPPTSIPVQPVMPYNYPSHPNGVGMMPMLHPSPQMMHHLQQATMPPHHGSPYPPQPPPAAPVPPPPPQQQPPPPPPS